VSPTEEGNERAQSHVVGVVLLLGITTVSMAVLAGSAGVVIDSTAASADATRAAGALADLAAGEDTRLELADARLHTVDRELRIGANATNASNWTTVDTGGLVYDNGDDGARLLAGAVQRGNRGFERDPAFGRGNGRVVLSVVALSGSIERSGSGTVRLRPDVGRSRRAIESADSVAVETNHTGPWELAFERAGGNVSVRDIDGDTTPSVVATFDVTGVDLSLARFRLRTARNARS